MQDQDLSAALRLLDYGVYFDLIGVPQPTSADGIAHYMLEEGVRYYWNMVKKTEVLLSDYE